jgi:hypothetical protein
MPPVPLALNAYKRTDAFQPESLCVNFYLEKDESGASPDNIMRLQRPALTRYMITTGAVRGIYQQDGVLDGTQFGVWGTNLYSFTASASTSIGSIGGTGRVPFAANYEKLFLLSGTTAYEYDGSDLSAIAMPDDREVQDIDTLNNFLLLACADGRWYWLEPGSGTVDALHFFTAESAPDGLVAVKSLGDEFFLFGRSTIEPWQPTGDSDAPFLRAGGRTFARGCIARDAVKRFDNSIIWPGDDGIIYRLGNVPQRISDHSIEERIRKRTGELSAMILEHDGHKFYVLKIPGQGSFVYDPASPVNGVWPEFRWAQGSPHVSTAIADGTWLVGDETQSRIYSFDPDSNDDDGAVMSRQLTGTLAFMGRSGKQGSLSIGTGSSDDFTLHVRWKDAQDDYPAHYEDIAARAAMDVVSLYRLGTPDQPYRTFELLIEDDVKVRISGAMANEGWR